MRPLHFVRVRITFFNQQTLVRLGLCCAIGKACRQPGEGLARISDEQHPICFILHGHRLQGVFIPEPAIGGVGTELIGSKGVDLFDPVNRAVGGCRNVGAPAIVPFVSSSVHEFGDAATRLQRMNIIKWHRARVLGDR